VETLNREKSLGGGGESAIIRRLQELQPLFVILGLIGRKEDPKKV